MYLEPLLPVSLSSFIYQQGNNNYNNKRILLEQYSTGKGNRTKYRWTNKNAVKNNQPAQEKSSDQETKGQMKMILSDEDLVKVVQ
jgi:hypothetical protein